jgi:hypothetical protein
MSGRASGRCILGFRIHVFRYRLGECAVTAEESLPPVLFIPQHCYMKSWSEGTEMGFITQIHCITQGCGWDKHILTCYSRSRCVHCSFHCYSCMWLVMCHFNNSHKYKTTVTKSYIAFGSTVTSQEELLSGSVVLKKLKWWISWTPFNQ